MRHTRSNPRKFTFWSPNHNLPPMPVFWAHVLNVVSYCFRLKVQCQPLDIVYHPIAMQCISQFFAPLSAEADQAALEAALPGRGKPGELSAAARRRYEQWKDDTKAGFQNTLDGLISIPETVSYMLKFASNPVCYCPFVSCCRPLLRTMAYVWNLFIYSLRLQLSIILFFCHHCVWELAVLCPLWES